MTTTFIFILTGIIIYNIVIFQFSKNKTNKTKNRLKQVDFSQELNNAEKYKEEYLNDNLPFIKEQMDGKPIDSFHFANRESNKTTMVKNLAKNGLKTLATLGMVRFHSVETLKYLVLSEGKLHLLDTDIDGNIDTDLVFNTERLAQSSIEEIELHGTLKALGSQRGDNIKGYRLTLATSHKPIELILFSALISTTSNITYTNDHQTFIKEIVIGNDFLQKLGELSQNLKVTTRILNM